MRHMTWFKLVALWLITAIHGSAMADENFRWRVDSFDTLVNKTETTYFDTEPEALAYKQKYEKVQNLQKGGPAYINWRITKERKPAKPDGDKEKSPKGGQKKGGDVLSRLRDAKAAVALAMKASKEELAKTELLLREAIDDYKQAVLDNYRRIQEFEKTLLGGTQEMQEKRFREINSLVDRYNRQVSDFQSVMGPSVQLGYKQLPRFEVVVAAKNEPAVPNSDGVTVVGKIWTIDYYGVPLVIKFQSGGEAVGDYNRRNDQRRGTWKVDGENILVVLQSDGRPGYSSYSEGFTVKGRIGVNGQLQVLDIQQNVK